MKLFIIVTLVLGLVSSSHAHLRSLYYQSYDYDYTRYPYTSEPTRKQIDLRYASFLLSPQGDEIRIPIDRCYDVQWNPPGTPVLNTTYLNLPYNDRTEERNGYYTFMADDNEMVYFVRKRSDGSIYPIFEEVDFILISDDVLMFESELYYGTLIKGVNTTADDSDGSWSTESTDTASTMEWLAANFAVPRTN